VLPFQVPKVFMLIEAVKLSEERREPTGSVSRSATQG
jgi:hypothetical protein